MPPLRLIAVDIDGTLLDSKFRVSEANLRALHDAHDAGIQIVLATGRRHSFTRPITSLLGFSPIIVSSNGAVTRCADGKLFSKMLMPKELACELLDTMQPWANQAVITMDREGPTALYVQSWKDVSARIALESVRLGDGFHQDPAGQIIVATARCHGLRLLTADDRIIKWGKVRLG